MLLRTLGELRLEGGSGDLSGRRKDLALLAYLARKAPAAVSRAELASLLWEDRDEARGRQSLRQALLGLRRVVGEGLAADPEQARLEAGTVGLDVKEFERAVAEGRMADAVGWWNGEFLPGLEEGGGEALRIWLEVEREGLRRALALALDRLSSDSAKAADWDQAVGWSERWTRFLPGDERGHIRLVETLSLAGRPSEAQVRHSAFLARLRTELEREPSAEVSALGRRLEREAARSSTPHRPGSAALFTPDLVGRGAALAELAAGWDAARSGHAVTVVVEGEPGIGKSRLAEEFLRRQEPAGAAVVVSVSAAAAGGGTDGLAAAVLGGLAMAPGLGAAAPETLAAIAARVPTVRQRFTNLPVTASDVSLSAAAVEALAAVVEERAVVLFVDDLERSPAEGLAFLAALARARVPSVLTILATAEDEGLAAGVAAAAGSRPRRLKLPPLTPAEVESLVASMLVLPAPERHALAARTHEEAGGNPLYCIELIAALVDEGALVVGERGTWILSHPERWSAPLSGNLRTMIERRTAGLGEEAHLVAETVARLGPSADEAALREAAGLPSERFDAGREELLGRRLLRTAAPPGRGYQFHHQLVRRAVLEDAGRRQRTAEETRRAAAAGKRRRLLVAGAVAALAIAVGAVVAIRHLTAKPQLTAGDRRQFVIAPVELPAASSPQDSAAARAFVAALERALSGRAVSPQAVAGYLARMRRTDTTAMGNRATAREVAIRAGARLLVVPALSHSASRLSLGYRLENTLTGETVLGREREMPPDASPSGPALSLAGSVARDAATASRQVPALDPLPNVTTSSIEALRAYASGNKNLNTEGGTGVTMMRRAVALDSTFASAQAMLAYLLWFDFDQRAAERHAIAALRSLDGLGRPESLKTRLRIANAVEDWPTAVDCARAFIELDPRNAHSWGDLGQLLYFNRQYTAAIAAYDSARALSPGSQSIFNLINRATVVARVNRFAEAVAGYEAGFRIDSAMLRQPFVNHEYGVALYRMGREADARAAYRARLSGTPSDRAGAFRSLALMEAHGGRFERAAGLLDDAVAGSTAADDTLEAAIGQVLRAEVAMTRGDTAAAAEALASAEQLAQAKPLPYEIVSRMVKLLARANAPVRAASLLQRLQEQTKAVSLQARARLLVARGEVLLAHGRTREGRRDLDQALALDPIPETMESGGYAAGRTGDWTLAAQRYDSLAASGGIDWDGHMALELGRYLAGRAWEQAGRRDRARERYQQFLDAWPASTADSTLPALLDARYRVGGPPGDIAGP